MCHYEDAVSTSYEGVHKIHRKTPVPESLFLINPFVLNTPFLYPDVFMGWRKGALRANGLMMIKIY